MKLSSKSISHNRQLSGPIQYHFETEDDQDIHLRKKCLIVGPAGSGKSIFSQSFFSKEQPRIFEHNLDQTLNDLNFNIQFEYNNHVKVIFDSLFEDIANFLARYAKTSEYKKKNQQPTYSSNDTYEEYYDYELTENDIDITSNHLFTLGTRIPAVWLTSRIKQSALINDTFTIADIDDNIKDILIDIFSDVEGLKKALIQISFPHSHTLNYVLTLLYYISSINEDINFSYNRFCETFNSFDSKWSISYEERTSALRHRANITNRAIKKDYEKVYVPILKRIGNDNSFYFEDLSSTQKLEVYRCFLGSILRLLDTSLQNLVVILDEPDRCVDPASTKYLLELLDQYSDAKQLFITSHSIPLFSQVLNRSDYDILHFSFDGLKTVIRKITDNSFEQRKVINRLAGNIDLVHPRVSIIEGFFNSAPEEYFMFTEGKTDIKILRFAQKEIIEKRLFSPRLQNFLQKSLITSFTIEDEDGHSSKNGASQLSHLLNTALDPVILANLNKKAVAIFDSDEAGFVESSKIHQTYWDRPGPGVAIQQEKKNIYYINLHLPKSISTNPDLIFTKRAGPETEHLFHHFWGKAEISVSSLELNQTSKKSFPKKIIKYYGNHIHNISDQEDFFREVYILFSSIMKKVSG